MKFFNFSDYQLAKQEHKVGIVEIHIDDKIKYDFFRFEFGFACSQHFKEECKKQNITGLEFSNFPIQSIF